jgi:hypothetical protein
MPPCAAADELHGLNRETAELNAGTLSTTRFRPKKGELSAAAESGTTGWRRTATTSMRRRNSGPFRAHQSFVLTEHQGYNAEVQRAEEGACDEHRVSRSRCNDQLYRRGVTQQRRQTPIAETLATERKSPDQRGPSQGALTDHATTAAAAQLR